MFHYFFGLGAEETLMFFLPLALLLDNTFLPVALAIRSLKPCLFLLFLFDGWYVLLLIINIFKNRVSFLVTFFRKTPPKSVGKYTITFVFDK